MDMPLQSEQMLATLSWLPRTFWTIDVIFSFLTGFMTDDGEAELHLRKAAKQYLRTWLPLDMGVLLLDYIIYFFEVAFRQGGEVKVARILKVIKVLRMLKIMRAVHFHRVAHVVDVTQALVFFGLSRVILTVVFINHTFACGWLALGQQYDHQTTWLVNEGYEDYSVFDGYFVAFHWSLTQFIGAMEVNPANTNERMAAICVLLCALLTLIIITPKITSLMMQGQMQRSEDMMVRYQLSDYLYENKVNRALIGRIQRAAFNAIESNRRMVAESELPILHLIPDLLLSELHNDIFAKHLLQHPFFYELSENKEQVFSQICHKATKQNCLRRGNVLFSMGDIPDNPAMYICMTGELEYISSAFTYPYPIGPGEVIAEPAIWTQWVHCGTLWAKSESRLLQLDVLKFQELMVKFESHIGPVNTYAKHYVHQLNKLPTKEVTDVGIGVDVSELARSAWHCDFESQRTRSFITEEQED
jgi:hypothetical protein